MIKVYDNEEVIGVVEYSDNLDHWDGRNYSNGGVGNHKGLTKLEDGRFVLIYGSDWEGHRDYGEIISSYDALQEVLKSDNDDYLLNEYPELKELYEKTMVKEAE